MYHTISFTHKNRGHNKYKFFTLLTLFRVNRYFSKKNMGRKVYFTVMEYLQISLMSNDPGIMRVFNTLNLLEC